MSVHIPRSKGEWASLLIAISFAVHGLALLIAGDPSGAARDLTAAFGTGILPGWLGSDWQVTITPTSKPDLTPLDQYPYIYHPDEPRPVDHR